MKKDKSNPMQTLGTTLWPDHLAHPYPGWAHMAVHWGIHLEKQKRHSDCTGTAMFQTKTKVNFQMLTDWGVKMKWNQRKCMKKRNISEWRTFTQVSSDLYFAVCFLLRSLWFTSPWCLPWFLILPVALWKSLKLHTSLVSQDIKASKLPRFWIPNVQDPAHPSSELLS